MSANSDDDCIIVSSDCDRPTSTVAAAANEVAVPIPIVPAEKLQQSRPVKNTVRRDHRHCIYKRELRIMQGHPGLKLWDQLKHLPNLSPDDIRNVAICDNCGVFMNKNEMAAHVKLEHSSEPPPVDEQQLLSNPTPPLVTAPPPPANGPTLDAEQKLLEMTNITEGPIPEKDEQQSLMTKCPLCSFVSPGKTVLDIHFETYHGRKSSHSSSELSILTMDASTEAAPSSGGNSVPFVDMPLLTDQQNSMPMALNSLLTQHQRQVSKSLHNETIKKSRIHDVVETVAVKNISDKEAVRLVFSRGPFKGRSRLSNASSAEFTLGQPTRNLSHDALHNMINAQDTNVASCHTPCNELQLGFTTTDQRSRNGQNQYNLRRQPPVRCDDDLHTLGMIQKAMAASLNKDSKTDQKPTTSDSYLNDDVSKVAKIVASIAAQPWSEEESFSLLKAARFSVFSSPESGKAALATSEPQRSKLNFVGFMCPICSHIATSYAAWKLHMDQTHNFLRYSTNNAYKCVCGFATDTEKNLWLHNAVCQTSKRVNCSLCTFVAPDSNKLHLHTKIAHKRPSSNHIVDHSRNENENDAVTSGISCIVKEENAGEITETPLTVLKPKAEIDNGEEYSTIFKSAEQMLLESMQIEQNLQHACNARSSETVSRYNAPPLNDAESTCSASSLQHLVTNVVELIDSISASKTLSQEKVNVISQMVSSIKETIIPGDQCSM